MNNNICYDYDEFMHNESTQFEHSEWQVVDDIASQVEPIASVAVAPIVDPIVPTINQHISDYDDYLASEKKKLFRDEYRLPSTQPEEETDERELQLGLARIEREERMKCEKPLVDHNYTHDAGTLCDEMMNKYNRVLEMEKTKNNNDAAGKILSGYREPTNECHGNVNDAYVVATRKKMIDKYRNVREMEETQKKYPVGEMLSDFDREHARCNGQLFQRESQSSAQRDEYRMKTLTDNYERDYKKINDTFSAEIRRIRDNYNCSLEYLKSDYEKNMREIKLKMEYEKRNDSLPQPSCTGVGPYDVIDDYRRMHNARPQVHYPTSPHRDSSRPRSTARSSSSSDSEEAYRTHLDTLIDNNRKSHDTPINTITTPIDRSKLTALEVVMMGNLSAILPTQTDTILAKSLMRISPAWHDSVAKHLVTMIIAQKPGASSRKLVYVSGDRESPCYYVYSWMRVHTVTLKTKMFIGNELLDSDVRSISNDEWFDLDSIDSLYSSITGDYRSKPMCCIPFMNMRIDAYCSALGLTSNHHTRILSFRMKHHMEAILREVWSDAVHDEMLH